MAYLLCQVISKFLLLTFFICSFIQYFYYYIYLFTNQFCSLIISYIHIIYSGNSCPHLPLKNIFYIPYILRCLQSLPDLPYLPTHTTLLFLSPNNTHTKKNSKTPKVITNKNQIRQNQTKTK